MSLRVAAAVLAAGSGSRFDGATHKLLAPFRGRRVIDWAVAAAAEAGLAETFVVAGAAALDGLDVPVVENPRWSEGMATSLQVAVRRAALTGCDALVVGLGDQPLIPTSAWAAVAGAEPSWPVVAATYGGQRRNPVRLLAAVWAELPDTGDEGARALMRERPDLVHEVACDGESADVDTVEDLHRWS